MGKKNTIPVRSSKEFKEWMARIGVNRVRKGVDDKIRSPNEVQDLMFRCPSIKKIDLELTNLPTKEFLMKKRRRGK